MTLAGWLIMSLSVGTVLTVFCVCFWLVLKAPHPGETLHGFEGDLPDPDDTENDSPK